MTEPTKPQPKPGEHIHEGSPLDETSEAGKKLRESLTKEKRGVVDLLTVAVIALAVLIAGGIATLVATGNSPQALSCVESAVNSNPEAVGNLVSGLSTNVQADGEAALAATEALGPGIGKCLLLDLWDDAKVTLARNAALKANARLVAPAPQIKSNAMALCVKHGWVPGATSTTATSTGDPVRLAEPPERPRLARLAAPRARPSESK